MCTKRSGVTQKVGRREIPVSGSREVADFPRHSYCKMLGPVHKREKCNRQENKKLIWNALPG